MSLVFCDSWDHYDVLVDKWTTGGTDCIIDRTGTKSRTGVGCLVIQSAAFGPLLNLPAPLTHMIVGTAYFSDSISNQNVIYFWDLPANVQNVRIQVLADGSIRVLLGNDPFPITLGTSAQDVYQFSAYNYIEADVVFGAAPNGSVAVYVNGALVLNITGVTTYLPGFSNPYCTSVQLLGAGAIADLRHDDTYILNALVSPNDQPLGAVRIYVQAPIADSTPLQWTPSTPGDHYVLVDEMPPDTTDYVASDTVGQIDQYEYLTTGVPPGSQIDAVQHVMDSALDAAGARSLGSSCGGTPSAISNGLTTTYQMYHYPYDINPLTGVAWDLGDFPNATFGPEVTL